MRLHILHFSHGLANKGRFSQVLPNKGHFNKVLLNKGHFSQVLPNTLVKYYLIKVTSVMDYRTEKK